MPNQIGQVPDFTPDGGQGEQEEVKQEVDKGESAPVEKETPAAPPAESEESEQKPAEEVKTPSSDDTRKSPEEVLNLAVAKATEGLRNEIVTLRRELAVAKGADRKVIQSKIDNTQDKIEDLKDIAPEDINLIDRVLRAKGYMTKEESSKMHYEAVKNEEIDKFLDEFPEYKPENDPNDFNWSALQAHIKTWYRMPDDPRKVGELLKKARREVAKASSDPGLEVKKQQVKTASSGSSGSQRSSSQKTANPRLSSLLRTHMQGWSDEEIKELEKKLPE